MLQLKRFWAMLFLAICSEWFAKYHCIINAEGRMDENKQKFETAKRFKSLFKSLWLWPHSILYITNAWVILSQLIIQLLVSFLIGVPSAEPPAEHPARVQGRPSPKGHRLPEGPARVRRWVHWLVSRKKCIIKHVDFKLYCFFLRWWKKSVIDCSILFYC